MTIKQVYVPNPPRCAKRHGAFICTRPPGHKGRHTEAYDPTMDKYPVDTDAPVSYVVLRMKKAKG